MKVFYSDEYVIAAEQIDTWKKSRPIAESLVARPIPGVEVLAAVSAALEDGVAGSLSSGLHHARRDYDNGLCTFNGLARVEAERLRRNRSGFFYVRERPAFSLHDEDANGFDPFRKVYLYGDEQTAAEDLAHVLYRVWDMPDSAPILATSGVFGEARRFDQATPLA